MRKYGEALDSLTLIVKPRYHIVILLSEIASNDVLVGFEEVDFISSPEEGQFEEVQAFCRLATLFGYISEIKTHNWDAQNQ